MLTVAGFSASYGGVQALKEVSLHVGDGEIVFIVGPNGAGKSTLLKAIAGLMPRAAGSILFEGQELSGQAPEKLCRRGLCLIPEGRHIFRTLTVQENLALGATIRRDRGAVAADIDRVTELFPVLADRFKGVAGHLSGGEQQQLAIARAILQRPRLLMIDEPSLGLAPLVIDQVYEKLRTLNDDGLTMMVVEQSTTRVLDLADRVYVLRNGRIVLSADAASLADGGGLEEAYFGYSAQAGESAVQ